MLNFRLRWRYKIICDAYYDTPALRELLTNPDKSLQPGAQLLKNDLKTTISVVNVDGTRVVVKRYNIVDRWHAIRRYFCQSRASVCWKAAHLLKTQQILTPQPIALIEKRCGFLKSTSYYIHEFVAGMDAAEYFTAEQKAGAWEAMAVKIADLVSKLKLCKISHGDLKVNNILIVDQKPWLIDLDDTRQHCLQFFAERAMKKDLQRFMNYWQDNNIIRALFETVFCKMDSNSRS